MNKLPKDTFEIFNAFKMMVNAEHHLASAMNNSAGMDKDLLRTWRTRLSVNIRDFRLRASPEMRAILDRDMLHPEVTFQMENINHMLTSLPKEYRDHFENELTETCEKLATAES